MSSEELCILASRFLTLVCKNSVLEEGVNSKKISSHLGRDPLKSVLKVGNA